MHKVAALRPTQWWGDHPRTLMPNDCTTAIPVVFQFYPASMAMARVPYIQSGALNPKWLGKEAVAFMTNFMLLYIAVVQLRKFGPRSVASRPAAMSHDLPYQLP